MKLEGELVLRPRVLSPTDRREQREKQMLLAWLNYRTYILPAIQLMGTTLRFTDTVTKKRMGVPSPACVRMPWVIHVPYTNERHDRQRWCEAKATINEGCAKKQFTGRIHGPMHAQRAYTRVPLQLMHAPRAYTRIPLPFMASLSAHEISPSSPVSPVTPVRVW